MTDLLSVLCPCCSNAQGALQLAQSMAETAEREAMIIAKAAEIQRAEAVDALIADGELPGKPKDYQPQTSIT